MTGKVVWFRGSFGFIRPSDGGKDIFVHWQGISGPKGAHKSLEAEDRVQYDIDLRIEDNQPIAVNVKKLEA